MPVLSFICRHPTALIGSYFLITNQVFQVTLESGLGHRTVPLLLAESSFNGLAKNWSSLLQLRGDMTLEVRAAVFHMYKLYTEAGSLDQLAMNQPLKVSKSMSFAVVSCRMMFK